MPCVVMNNDVAMGNNTKSWNGSLDGDGTTTNIGADTDADNDPGTRCLLLEFLPRDLLTQSILTNYLDGDALANFWCATMSKGEMLVRRNSPKNKSRSGLSSPSSHSSSMVEEIIRIIRCRRALLTEEESYERTTDNQRYCLRRQVFQAFEEAIVTQSSGDTASGGEVQAKKANGSDGTETGQSLRIEANENGDGFFNFQGFLHLSQRTFGRLLAVDYCERVPHNLIWCGFLRLCNRHHGEMASDQEPIKVALVVHPRRWSMKEIRLWRNATTWSSSSSGPSTSRRSSVTERRRPTVKANIIPHNFLPVGPNRGRLVGLTESDRRSLREISDELNRSELVGRFSCMIASVADRDGTATNTKSVAAAPSISDHNGPENHGGQFTVKLMGFAQAQRKLTTVLRRGYEPGGIALRDEKDGMVLHNPVRSYGNGDCVNHDRNSLLCCWNHEFLWEDSRAFRMETSYALRDTMKEYDRLVQ